MNCLTPGEGDLNCVASGKGDLNYVTLGEGDLNSETSGKGDLNSETSGEGDLNCVPPWEGDLNSVTPGDCDLNCVASRKGDLNSVTPGKTRQRPATRPGWINLTRANSFGHIAPRLNSHSLTCGCQLGRKTKALVMEKLCKRLSGINYYERPLATE